MPWDALQYITGGFSLLAFVVSVGAWVYKAHVDKTESLIKGAPEDERAKIILETLEHVKINPNKLTKAQQYELALTQIRERSARWKMMVVAILSLAIVFAIIAIVALLLDTKEEGPSGFDQKSQKKPTAAEVDKPVCKFGQCIKVDGSCGAVTISAGAIYIKDDATRNGNACCSISRESIPHDFWEASDLSSSQEYEGKPPLKVRVKWECL